ncbi:MAG TPA: peroxiredoxin [Mycobacteriales bacterium]|nr:peroxiredoxin [Mycobacteriales bacterium]
MPVEVGTVAPEFELRDQHRQRVRLSDYRGRKNVLLVFYPFSFTSVCTGELCTIRDDLPAFQNDADQVLAISCDSVYTQRVFADQEGLDYPLLSDFWPHGAVARAYGVFDDTIGAALRGSFVVDRAGIVRWTVVNALPDARDVAAYQKVLAGL